MGAKRRGSCVSPTLITEQSRQGQEYFEWLAKKKGWTVKEAHDYAMSQPRYGLIAVSYEQKSP
jgi:hypothetical protein